MQKPKNIMDSLPIYVCHGATFCTLFLPEKYPIVWNAMEHKRHKFVWFQIA